MHVIMVQIIETKKKDEMKKKLKIIIYESLEYSKTSH